jgi:4-amino-4-deoxy-L-arabinose transferase-like glycosyltransferase
MAFLGAVAALLAAAGIAIVAAAAGLQLLPILHHAMNRASERLLLGAALGVIALEIGFFLAQALRPARIACAAVVALAAAFGARQFAEVYRIAATIFRDVWKAPLERGLLVLTLLVLLWQGIAATAPLTGSDALNYHFAAPLAVLRNGFQPDFSLTQSFLTGQDHTLIFAGLALGSERLALALSFTGGVLAAAASACLAREWVSRRVAWLVSLTFMLTPVVFWQMTSAGAPDLWMAFFAVVAVFCIARIDADSSVAMALTCGFLAGAMAGAKYTGCILAVVLLGYVAWQARSLRRTLWFIAGALGVGIWPYTRNWMWTGDPVFPFAMRWLHPQGVNAFALQALRADTGVAAHRSFWQLAKFPFFAAIDASQLGFWQFFGPLCLMFLPFFLFLIKRTPAWRATAVLWIVGSFGIGLSSGMTRFLLPLFPIALAAAFGGAAALWNEGGRASRAFVALSTGGFLIFGFGGMLVYTRPAVATAVGRIEREDYLAQRVPNYELSSFVNQALAEEHSDQRVLIFFRHLYYVRVPYVYGEPAGSWSVDPAVLRDAQSWRSFFREQRIAWVLRAPEYPKRLAPSLLELESESVLVPFAEREVSDFDGNRLQGQRKIFRATLLAVKQ